jgi:hypothetical protein
VSEASAPDRRLTAPLAKPGSRELLAALHRHPGQCVGAYWSAGGVPLASGTLQSRLATFRRHGLVEIGRTVLTERGRQVLERLA